MSTYGGTTCGRRIVEPVSKAFKGPVRRAASYAEWAAGHSEPSGHGVGPKTLARAKELTGGRFGMMNGRGKSDRAFSIWQRDNNMKGHWVGNPPEGRHVSLDDARWESGVYGVNTKQQRKMATADLRARDGKKVSPVKARRGVANNLEMYEHPNDFTDRVRRGEFKKGVTRQGVMPVLARVRPAAARNGKRLTTGTDGRTVIGKFAPGGLLHGVKQTGKIMGANFKAGAAQRGGATGVLAKPKLSLSQSVLGSQNPAVGALGRTSMWAGRNPGTAGLTAGAAGGVAATSIYGVRKADVSKRTFDPEGDRRYRQGAAAAATGIGGLYLGQRGVRQVRADSKGLRELDDIKARPVPPELRPTYSDGKPRPEKNVKARLNEIHNAQQHNAYVAGRRAKLKGVQVTARSGGKLAAGLGLLATSGTLLRNRHQDRWD